jgi:DNA repair protein RAD50
MIDLSALDARRDAIRAFKIELTEQQEIEEGLMEDKKQVQAELDALEAKLEHLGSILANVGEVEGALDELRREEHRLQTALERQREMLENDLTDRHTLQEIRDMLLDFDEKVARHKEEERKVLDREQALQAKIDNLHAREMELKSDMGKWAAKKEAHEECLKDRLSRMERLAQTYSIDLQNVTQLTQGTNVSFLANTVNESIYPSQDEVASYELTPEAWAAFKRAVAKKQSELQQQLKDFQDKSRHEDDKFQKEINELGAKIAGYDLGTLVRTPLRAFCFSFQGPLRLTWFACL